MLSILGGPALRFPLWFQSLKPSPFAVLPVSTSLNSTPFVVPHRSTVGGMPPRLPCRSEVRDLARHDWAPIRMSGCRAHWVAPVTAHAPRVQEIGRRAAAYGFPVSAQSNWQRWCGVRCRAGYDREPGLHRWIDELRFDDCTANTLLFNNFQTKVD